MDIVDVLENFSNFQAVALEGVKGKKYWQGNMATLCQTV
jgi:hypothetical protein